MAKVTVAQVGSVTKELEAETVKEALAQFGLEGNYQVKVNGATTSMEGRLSEGAFISVGEKVKGGLVK